MFKSFWKQQSAPPPLLLNVMPSPGLFTGTRIATSYDWTPVEDLSVGDVVLTGDNQEQPITGLSHGKLSLIAAKAAMAHWPIVIPEDALGNDRSLLIAPKMRFVVDIPLANSLFDHARVSLKAESLIGHFGITRAQLDKPFKHVTLQFEQPEMLVVEGGLMLDLPSPKGVQGVLPLNDRQARLLMRHMSEDDRKAQITPQATAWI